MSVLFTRRGMPSTAIIFTFWLDVYEYQAEEGMTWAEWCDSEYNDSSEHDYVWYVNDNTIYENQWGGTIMTYPDEVFVKPSDVIDKNLDYEIYMPLDQQ